MKNDIAYANRDFIPNADAILERWDVDARQWRELEAAVGRARLNEPYGRHERERLDLFYPAGQAKGLVVFVHGGYWRLLHRHSFSHFAAGATARGWAVALPSYVLAPEASIADITRQIAAAIARAAELVPGPIALTGHSAGGHLVARMACADSGLPLPVRARITSIAPISPLSDLRPLIETTMNEDLGLDDASARAESPALVQKALDVPVDIWVGGDERPALLDQARWLAEAWQGAELHIVNGRHHFDILDDLKDPKSELLTRLLG
jgi:acetyl esterase/lipase